MSSMLIFGNYVLTVAIFSWAAAQILKTLINAIKFRKMDFERLVGAGGMPSSHSALVCSMTVGFARKSGLGSSEFALACLFAMVVMYDAMGVRRAAGEQAKVINKYFLNKKREQEDKTITSTEKKRWRERLKKEAHQKLLKEYLGHTPLEVLCGAILGIVMAFVIPMK